MVRSRTLTGCTLSLVVGLTLALPAQAVPIPDLQVRLDGLVYYDAVLNVSWLTDANLAASNTFGLPQSEVTTTPGPGVIGTTSRMTWDTALQWIAGMNAANYLGFDDWRLPTQSPMNGTTFSTEHSNNGTTDRGYGATGVGWETLTGEIVSEMGWMYYGNLGNLGLCMPDGDPGCTTQAGSGLANTGPFQNLQSFGYWSGTEFDAISAYRLNFSNGSQGPNDKEFSHFYAWAVRSGDVVPAAQLPEPSTLLLFGVGLIGGIVARSRARRRAGASVL